MDPLQHQQPGPFNFSHVGFNQIIDAARIVRNGKWRPKDAPQPGAVEAWCEVLVRNDTGSDLDEYSVLVPGATLEDLIDYPLSVQDRPAFAGAAPTAVTDQPMILREPIPDGGIGRATISGVAVVDVLLNSTSHQYAAPRAGSTAYLDTAAFGPCRILYKEQRNSSFYRAVVLMGIDRAGPGTCQKVITSVTCSGSTLTVSDITIWLPPGAELWNTESECETQHPGAV